MINYIINSFMRKNGGFTLIELLVVVAIIGILAGIAFVSISEARLSAYDTQIRSELSQIRSNAEQYYYRDGTYEGYDDDGADSGWDRVKGQIPGCSADQLPDGADEEYQIAVDSQAYAAWAPLCSEEVYYCVDSTGAADNFDGNPTTNGNFSCEDVFSD